MRRATELEEIKDMNESDFENGTKQALPTSASIIENNDLINIKKQTRRNLTSITPAKNAIEIAPKGFFPLFFFSSI